VPGTIVFRERACPSPVVVRLRPSARLWQSSARLCEEEMPPPVRALLAGRRRLELSPAEADAVLAWARQVPGWESDGEPALTAYPLAHD
jgi:hypothetical protein